MVLEPACEYADCEPMEVVAYDDGDGEVNDFMVEETDIDNKDMPPSGVVFWSGRAALKALGACASLLLPTPRLGFRDIVYAGNIAWANKAQSIVELCGLQRSLYLRIPIICRPSGFGKTSFLTMLQSFHNIRDDKPAPARRVFSQLSLDYVFGHEANLRKYHFQDHLILTFDLRNLDVSSPQVFKQDLLDEIDNVLSDFIWRYGYLLDQDGSKRVDPTIFDSVGRFDLFGALLEWLLDAGLPVFLVVDNYDSAQRASNGDSQITHILSEHFVSPLRHFSGKFIHRGIVVGEATPTELRQRCGYDIWTSLGEDRSGDYRLATAFGFTRSEIRHLCITFGIPGVEKEIFASLAGHRFSDHVQESVYCTKDVLDFLRRQPGLANRTYLDCYFATKEQLWNGMSSTTV
ncbi:hypothetical protein CPB85DRAFT_1280186 [Mucidula mucida]|nr:hypothetical protein CPB85DRAFT_1280186 [Mucidula mucida]